MLLFMLGQWCYTIAQYYVMVDCSYSTPCYDHALIVFSSSMSILNVYMLILKHGIEPLSNSLHSAQCPGGIAFQINLSPLCSGSRSSIYPSMCGCISVKTSSLEFFFEILTSKTSIKSTRLSTDLSL